MTILMITIRNPRKMIQGRFFVSVGINSFDYPKVILSLDSIFEFRRGNILNQITNGMVSTSADMSLTGQMYF